MNPPQPPPQKTIADHLAMFICPLLIMLMVGSLALFLAKIGYAGRYASRVNWALCWFVLGSVLISRIGIQHGTERSSVYGLLLGGAISFFFYRFIGFGLPLFILLAILCFIWWCTSQLTWDCTFIEDDEDASGQGLLEASGLDGDVAKEAAADAKKHPLRRKRRLWWQHLFGSQANRKGQPHAPGIWIILFSLLSLPLFGIGQLKFGTEASADRDYGFMLLAIYVAASLSLLLLTSFLGLRRYLRQRRLEMPWKITSSWIIYGVILAALVMGACLLLPRPNAKITLPNLITFASSNIVLKASEHAWLGGEAGEGEGKRIGEGEGEPKGEEQKKGAGGGQGEQKSKTGEGQEQGEGKGKPKSDPQAKTETSKQGQVSSESKQDGQKDPQQKEGQPQPQNEQPEPSVSSVEEKTNWVKIILYILLALTAAYLIWRYRLVLREMLKALLKAIRDFLDSFKRQPQPAEQQIAPEPPKLRFSDFTNPFASGQAGSMPPETLVAYTFEALQCWAKEQGHARGHGETPYEFALRLGQKEPMLDEATRQLAWFYTRLAYAQQSPPESVIQHARQMWEFMSVAQAVAA